MEPERCGDEGTRMGGPMGDAMGEAVMGKQGGKKPGKIDSMSIAKTLSHSISFVKQTMK